MTLYFKLAFSNKSKRSGKSWNLCDRLGKIRKKTHYRRERCSSFNLEKLISDFLTLRKFHHYEFQIFRIVDLMKIKIFQSWDQYRNHSIHRIPVLFHDQWDTRQIFVFNGKMRTKMIQISQTTKIQIFQWNNFKFCVFMYSFMSIF